MICWHGFGWSDRAPAPASVGRRRRAHSGQRPISALILRQPEFPRQPALLEAAADLDRLLLFERLETHKALISEAADIVCKQIEFRDDDQSLTTKCCKYSHLARVVAGNQITQTKTLIGRGGNDASILQVSQGSLHVSTMTSRFCALRSENERRAGGPSRLQTVCGPLLSSHAGGHLLAEW